MSKWFRENAPISARDLTDEFLRLKRGSVTRRHFLGVTGLGLRDCSSQTARINQNQQKVGPFDLVVEGALQPVGASVASGNLTGCRPAVARPRLRALRPTRTSGC